jgi:hypothetical protein
MKLKTLFAGALGVSMIAACTTSEKVSVMQPGDQRMSCAELETEFNNLELIKRDAERDGGVNTANVASVLLFWPAAVGNYLNANEAQELVEDRRRHLMTIYDGKGC